MTRSGNTLTLSEPAMPDPGVKWSILQANVIGRPISQPFPGNLIHFKEKTMDMFEQEGKKRLNTISSKPFLSKPKNHAIINENYRMLPRLLEMYVNVRLPTARQYGLYSVAHSM